MPESVKGDDSSADYAAFIDLALGLRLVERWEVAGGELWSALGGGYAFSCLPHLEKQ